MAVIEYTRVSHTDQVEGVSLDGQSVSLRPKYDGAVASLRYALAVPSRLGIIEEDQDDWTLVRYAVRVNTVLTIRNQHEPL